MPRDITPGKPSTRRYSQEEKDAAVRMVRTLRAELGTDIGTIARVARQLGYGLESVRAWVRQAEIDEGRAPGVSTDEAGRVKALEQENRELRRANEILRRAATFFGAELDRQQGNRRRSSTPTAMRSSRDVSSGSSPSDGSCVSRAAGGPQHLLRRQESSALGPVAARRGDGPGRCAALWQDNYRVYGAHKLWKAARRAGHDIGRDQVARLMRQAGIEGVRRDQEGPDHPARAWRLAAPGPGRS